MKNWLRNWLLGDLVDEINKMSSDYGVIRDHLSNISGLADYVREKDEKAQELFALLEAAPEPKLSKDEIDSELHTAASIKVALLDSPAIGTREILEKNSKLSRLDETIKDLTKRRQSVNST